MVKAYDDWERLVVAVLRREQYRELCRLDSLSSASSSDSSSFRLSSSFSNLSLGAYDQRGWPKYTRPLPFQDLARIKVDIQNDKAELVVFEGSLGLQELLMAPSYSLGEEIEAYNRTYVVSLRDGTVNFVVKRLITEKFSREEVKEKIEFFKEEEHENIVKMKGYYLSKNARLVIYDYYPQGSVHAMLHGENQGKLDWKTRLRIALGVARGIAHIHSQRGKKLVHGNVKSSNVFLNSQRYVCVSDFGLTGIMIGAKFEHSTVGYHAPEVKGTKDTSQESDVYSFGILLLELLTGKSPVRISTSHKATDLVGWVNSFKRTDWALEVIDEDLIYGSRDVEQWLIQLLEIGITCVAKSPQKRPKMASVVEMMEDISPKNISIDISAIAKPKALVCLNISRIRRFDLEDLLRASAGKLGRGTIGSSYKARLESGIIVTVKRTRNVVVEKKEFDEHINVVGSIRHDNV